jgi:putative ABC transport system ATP-binding protein
MNTATPLIKTGERPIVAIARSHVMLKDFNISEIENKKPKEISADEKRLVLIARTMIKKPLVILADEPTANMNNEDREKIANIFKYRNSSEHTTIVISTQDDLLLEQAKKIIFLKDGAMIVKNYGTVV